MIFCDQEWNLFVQPEDFWRMLREVERKIAWEKGEEHGSFNYTDLLVLSENGIILKTIKALMSELSKVIHLKMKEFFKVSGIMRVN